MSRLRARPFSGHSPTPSRAVAVAAFVAAAFVVTLVPSLSFAYRSVEAHMVIETSAALTTALAAVLVYGRFQRRTPQRPRPLRGDGALRRHQRTIFSMLPPLVGADRAGTLVTWGSVLGGSCRRRSSPWRPSRPTRKPVRQAASGQAVLLLAALLFASIIAVVVAFGGVLPAAIDPSLSPEDSSRPRIVSSPAVLGQQIVGMVLFTAAAIGFLRQAERTGEELSAWLAAAAVTGRLRAAELLPLPVAVLGVGVPRTSCGSSFFALLCAGAAREILRAQRVESDLAVLEERRRVARDIHDGLAEELLVNRHAYAAAGRAHDGAARRPAPPRRAGLVGRATGARRGTFGHRCAHDVLRRAARRAARPSGGGHG